MVLANFTNSTGDAVFNDTLKTALNIALSQSPFLNVLPDSKVQATLKLMARPASTPLTPEVAGELCQRVGSKAYIAGSISSLGSEYVLGLKVVNCQSGDVLAQDQVTATAKEKVLDAVREAAVKLREQLGESLATVQKFDVPLQQATTSSLPALKAYSQGQKVYDQKGPAVAVPYHLHAVELDPNFAMAYWMLGKDYAGHGESQKGAEYYQRAYELRDHASEREKLTIASFYTAWVIGNQDKAAQAYQQLATSYPRDVRALDGLALVFNMTGQYEKVLETLRQSEKIDPNGAGPNSNLGNCLLALQRFDEARQAVRNAEERGIDNFFLHAELYALAFLRSDTAGMAEQLKWYRSSPVENFGLSLASDTAAYAGHLSKARELTQQALHSAMQADSKENGAVWLANAALREAAFGNNAEAKHYVAQGFKLAPASQGVDVEAGLAYAMAGDNARAESLAKDLNKRFPEDTQVQSLWLPAIRARLELNHKNPAGALKELQAATGSVELGQIPFLVNLSCLEPTYIRGEAYLASGQGSAAAAQFQKILDHNGLVWNCWTGALAHLGVARAEALEARTSQGADAETNREKALAAYRVFLTLWKTADPDIPILKQARTEYAGLQ